MGSIVEDEVLEVGGFKLPHSGESAHVHQGSTITIEAEDLPTLFYQGDPQRQ